MAGGDLCLVCSHLRSARGARHHDELDLKKQKRSKTYSSQGSSNIPHLPFTQNSAQYSVGPMLLATDFQTLRSKSCVSLCCSELRLNHHATEQPFRRLYTKHALNEMTNSCHLRCDEIFTVHIMSRAQQITDRKSPSRAIVGVKTNCQQLESLNNISASGSMVEQVVTASHELALVKRASERADDTLPFIASYIQLIDYSGQTCFSSSYERHFTPYHA